MRAALLALAAAGTLCIGSADAPAAAAMTSAAPSLGSHHDASAAELLGTVLIGPGGQKLGTVTDLLVDGSQHRVAFIGLALAGAGRSTVALPWTSLIPGERAGDYRTGDLLASVAADLPFTQQAAVDPGFLDVRRDLLGRPVLAAAGQTVGRLIDFDVDLRSGAIGHLFITTTEMAEGSPAPRAIAWSAIADLDNQRAIVLNLDLADLRHAPPASDRAAGSLASD